MQQVTVLVHGNPETRAVWDLVAAQLPEPPVRLSPPGFGAPVPRGFRATVDGYRDWLIASLEAIGRPVHLVGHDWGGTHVVNVAIERPDLLLSWATDTIGSFDPGYEWHELARIWQTEGAGERWIAKALASPVSYRAARMICRGADPAIALRVARGFNPAMGACILSLYRDAAQPAMARRGAGLERAAARPGLVLVAERDVAVGTVEQRLRGAERAGATVARLPHDHWWLLEDGGRAGAEALRSFHALARNPPEHGFDRDEPTPAVEPQRVVVAGHHRDRERADAERFQPFVERVQKGRADAAAACLGAH
jgi:pimeloyl-ACP methyl ester carboxylesterase